MSIVKTLVEYGSDKNVPDENGHTAIHHAAANGHLLVLHYLQTGSTFHELFYWPIVKGFLLPFFRMKCLMNSRSYSCSALFACTNGGSEYGNVSTKMIKNYEKDRYTT